MLVLYSEMTSWAQLGWIEAEVSAWLWLSNIPLGSHLSADLSRAWACCGDAQDAQVDAVGPDKEGPAALGSLYPRPAGFMKCSFIFQSFRILKKGVY